MPFEQFTIEYKRTVRVREYETLTIGLHEDFDKSEMSRENAFQMVKYEVEEWISETLQDLKKK